MLRATIECGTVAGWRRSIGAAGCPRRQRHLRAVAERFSPSPSSGGGDDDGEMGDGGAAVVVAAEPMGAIDTADEPEPAEKVCANACELLEARVENGPAVERPSAGTAAA